MVGAVDPAAGAAGGAVLSAAGDHRAAEWRHAARLFRPAAGFSSQAKAASTLGPHPTRNRFTGERNASVVFRIGSGRRRGGRKLRARDGVRRWLVRQFVLAV